MKVTDLNEIRAAVVENLSQMGSDLLDYLTLDEALDCITMIYVTNNMMRGFAQDFIGNPSIVSSPYRIGIIYQGRHSFYKVDGTICDYEDLDEDVESIRVAIDAALARWEDRGV